MTGKAMACMMAGAVFSMFGCSAEDRASAAEVTAEPGRILIAYYSYSGNTRFAAEQIQKATGGELFEVKEFGKYEVIFVGTPNWWSTMAPPVLAFLSSYEFSGKTVIPFVTHGGGGMARCETDMRKAVPKAKFGKGRAFSGGSIRHSGDAITNWANETVTVRK